jgi:hypothetical protein
MLAKLIKHEFKATARIFLPILGTVLVLTGAAALTVKLGGILVLPGGTGWGGPVLGLASGLLCLLTFIAMMAMMTAAVVVTIQRFYKNLLGDEGYLMFTLPVTPAQHITAKLAVGTVWTLLSLALAVLAAAALIFSIPGAAENGMTLARFSAAFRAELALPDVRLRQSRTLPILLRGEQFFRCPAPVSCYRTIDAVARRHDQHSGKRDNDKHDTQIGLDAVAVHIEGHENGQHCRAHDGGRQEIGAAQKAQGIHQREQQDDASHTCPEQLFLRCNGAVTDAHAGKRQVAGSFQSAQAAVVQGKRRIAKLG